MTADKTDDEIHEALRTVQQFMAWLNVCGCGSPGEVVLGTIAASLARFERAEPFTLATYPDDPRDVFMLYLLDIWELTQHGGNVFGSWLTKDGQRLRAALDLIDIATYDDVIDDSWWNDEAKRLPAGTTLTYGEWKPSSLPNP